MPDNDVWPPKPALPDPLMEYDELISERLAASLGGRSRYDRFKLVKALHEEKGMGWPAALATVESYRRRHFPPPGAKFFVALGVAASVIALPQLYQIALKFHRNAVLSQPNHRAALLALNQRIAFLDLVVIVALTLTLGAVMAGVGTMLYRKRRSQ